MGKFCKSAYYLLGLFCSSLVAVQALAADRPSVTIDANTGRVTTTPQTYQLPRGATLNVQQTNLPATMSQGTMNVPLSARVNPPAGRGFDARSLFKVGTPALRNSLHRCLTSFRCNMAAQAGAAGFGAFIDGLDWVMTDGAQPRPLVSEYPFEGVRIPPATTPVSLTTTAASHTGGCNYPNICSGGTLNGRVVTSTSTAWVCSDGTPVQQCFTCARTNNDNKLIGASGAACQYGPSSAPDPDSMQPTMRPVSDSELVAALPSYQPQASDWPMLSGGVDLGDDGITIEGDFLELPDSEVITENLPNGTTRRTTTTVEPNWFDNPSKQPGIEFSTSTKVDIYNEFGDIITSETSTITSGRAGVGGSAGPIDCEFMPTVCRFITWFTEPDPELNNEPDFSAIRDDIEPGDNEIQIGDSTAACPPPIQISFSMFPSTEVSLQPLCDFVDLLRPLVLMLSFFAAAHIVLRS